MFNVKYFWLGTVCSLDRSPLDLVAKIRKKLTRRARFVTKKREEDVNEFDMH